VLSLLYSLDCMAAFELVKLMEADCDWINPPVPIPENYPLYSHQRHHQERAIIARVIRWIARGCDKKVRIVGYKLKPERVWRISRQVENLDN
jgi:hypothetical protein